LCWGDLAVSQSKRPSNFALDKFVFAVGNKGHDVPIMRLNFTLSRLARYASTIRLLLVLKIKTAPTENIKGQQSYLGGQFDGPKRRLDFTRGSYMTQRHIRMDGVAGHAGLFSTADDLARFCQMLLNGGGRPG
jgi:CubicO group peptidase (beta-lactamase class C family)